MQALLRAPGPAAAPARGDVCSATSCNPVSSHLVPKDCGKCGASKSVRHARLRADVDALWAGEAASVHAHLRLGRVRASVGLAREAPVPMPVLPVLAPVLPPGAVTPATPWPGRRSRRSRRRPSRGTRRATTCRRAWAPSPKSRALPRAWRAGRIRRRWSPRTTRSRRRPAATAPSSASRTRRSSTASPSWRGRPRRARVRKESTKFVCEVVGEAPEAEAAHQQTHRQLEDVRLLEVRVVAGRASGSLAHRPPGACVLRVPGRGAPAQRHSVSRRLATAAAARSALAPMNACAAPGATPSTSAWRTSTSTTARLDFDRFCANAPKPKTAMFSVPQWRGTHGLIRHVFGGRGSCPSGGSCLSRWAVPGHVHWHLACRWLVSPPRP